MAKKVSNFRKIRLLLWKNFLRFSGFKFSLLFAVAIIIGYAVLFVVLRWRITPREMNSQTYPPIQVSHREFQQGSTLFCYPDSVLSQMLVKEAATNLKISEVKFFEEKSEMEEALLAEDVLAGVEFSDDLVNANVLPKKLTFSLRFPSELRVRKKPTDEIHWHTMHARPLINEYGPRNPKSKDGGVISYLGEGFLPIQYEISMAYLRNFAKDRPIPHILMQRFPYGNYVYDKFRPTAQFLITMTAFIIIELAALLSGMLHVLEKEHQLKEIMKIMGVNNWIHWTAWFIVSLVCSCVIFVGFAITLMLGLLMFDTNLNSYSNIPIIVLFILLCTISITCHIFMFTAFFTNGTTFDAVVGVVLFLQYIFYLLLRYQKIASFKLIVGLLPIVILSFGFQVVFENEATGKGLQWNNIMDVPNIDNGMSMGFILIMCVFDSIIYMLICLYVEQVFPGQYGVPKKWYFPIQKNFWIRKKYDGKLMMQDQHLASDGKTKNTMSAFEDEPNDKVPGIQIRNLKKKFGDEWAVKNLNLNMYENEITVLLGQNGAGKTTTMSILTGMYPPTSGTAVINGSDIRNDIEGARVSIGFCPQHNILFDELSVYNHLKFYSILKGLKGVELKDEIKKYLEKTELHNQSNVVASKLSGGMKRKLSICCALCGYTKIVLCDEPSSGMDPAARRRLWDLLQSEKMGRTILLTTHFMDEADVLGDRIAIMCAGELKCYGTPFFLKKKYGSGYLLICVKLNDCVVGDVTLLLQKYIPNIKPENEIGSELKYVLPHKDLPKFEKMLSDLEQNEKRLKLNGFGISNTPMEEVFMKVNLSDEDENINDNNILEEESSSGNESEDYKNGKKYEWTGLLLKKYIYIKRSYIAILFEIILIIFLLCISLTQIIENENGNGLPPLTLDIHQHSTATVVLERAANIQKNSFESIIAEKYEKQTKNWGEKYQIEFTGNEAFDDYILRKSDESQLTVDLTFVAGATIENGLITAWFNNKGYHNAPLSLNLVHNALARTYIDDDAEITVINKPLPISLETLSKMAKQPNSTGITVINEIGFLLCFLGSLFAAFIVKERKSGFKFLQHLNGIGYTKFWLSHFMVDLFLFIIFNLIMCLVIAFFQVQCLSTASELLRLFLVLNIFACAALPMTYILSFLFKEPSMAFIMIFLLALFTGQFLFAIVNLICSLSGRTFCGTGKDWLIVFPHYNVLASVFSLFQIDMKLHFCENEMVTQLSDSLRCELMPECCEIISHFSWSKPGILKEIIIMLLMSVLFFILIIVLECSINGKIWILFERIKKKDARQLDDLDENVKEEQERVAMLTKEETAAHAIVVNRIHKSYMDVVAVNQISFLVDRSDCFGLLGTNGAGKTTTFRILIGDTNPTYGKAFINGMDLSKNLNKIYKDIGYCPQFQAILDNYTGRETLKIILLIRGVNKKKLTIIINNLANLFDFGQLLDKKISEYSGGNKRKISTAISVIGNPAILYLDEPTTGIDPRTRRNIWNILNDIREYGNSIVLSSHNMEECEALCTRLAIMVNGEIKCIGSCQHLKNRFAKGFVLKMKLQKDQNTLTEQSTSDAVANDQERTTSESISDINAKAKNFIMQNFPNANLQEEYQTYLSFHLPYSNLKWSQIFGLIEKNRKKLKIEDYSISQTTLEEIFLDFAKHQRNE